MRHYVSLIQLKFKGHSLRAIFCQKYLIALGLQLVWYWYGMGIWYGYGVGIYEIHMAAQGLNYMEFTKKNDPSNKCFIKSKDIS